MCHEFEPDSGIQSQVTVKKMHSSCEILLLAFLRCRNLWPRPRVAAYQLYMRLGQKFDGSNFALLHPNDQTLGCFLEWIWEGEHDEHCTKINIACLSYEIYVFYTYSLDGCKNGTLTLT